MSAKLSHKAVQYRETDGPDRCDRCRHFIHEPMFDCELVQKPIEPDGWCRLYVKSPTAGSRRQQKETIDEDA